MSSNLLNDPDKHDETWTDNEIDAELRRQVELGYPVAFCLGTDGGSKIIETLLEVKLTRPVPIQVNAGPMDSLQGPLKINRDLIKLALEGKIWLYFHLPLVFNMFLPLDKEQVKWETDVYRQGLAEAYIKYITNLLKDYNLACEEIGGSGSHYNINTGLVVHGGIPHWPGQLVNSNENKSKGIVHTLGGAALGKLYVPAEKSSLKEWQVFRARYWSNLDLIFGKLLESYGGLIRLLIENGVGTDKAPLPVNNISWIGNEIIGQAFFEKIGQEKFYNFGLCWDTEHSFGAGESFSECLEQGFIENIDLIHLNGAPSNVSYGSRKDLHNYTSLSKSLEAGTLRLTEKHLVDLVRSGKPLIYEREHYSLMLEDSKWLGSMSNKKADKVIDKEKIISNEASKASVF